MVFLIARLFQKWRNGPLGGVGSIPVLFVILKFFSVSIWATGASSEFELFQQPDGTGIELRNAGGEWFHWHETRDGFVAVQDTDGYWKYGTPRAGTAELLAVPGGIVGRTSAGKLGLRPRELPSSKEIGAYIRRVQGAGPGFLPLPLRLKAQNERLRSSENKAAAAVSFGTQKVRCVVILAAFSNHWSSVNETVSTNWGFPPSEYERPKVLFVIFFWRIRTAN